MKIDKIMALSWNTIHLFNFGQTQIIGKGFNTRVDSSSLTTLPTLVAEIYTHKPITYTGNDTYRIITMLNGHFIDWSEMYIPGSPSSGAPEPQSFRIQISTINQTIFDAFVTELSSLIPGA